VIFESPSRLWGGIEGGVKISPNFQTKTRLLLHAMAGPMSQSFNQ
jgi:hypothetical protein